EHARRQDRIVDVGAVVITPGEIAAVEGNRIRGHALEVDAELDALQAAVPGAVLEDRLEAGFIDYVAILVVVRLPEQRRDGGRREITGVQPILVGPARGRNGGVAET